MIIHLSAKCSDLFSMTVYDDKGGVLTDYDGYVPFVIPGGKGDYIQLEIDVESGRILNWNTTRQEVANFVAQYNENKVYKLIKQSDGPFGQTFWKGTFEQMKDEFDWANCDFNELIDVSYNAGFYLG